MDLARRKTDKILKNMEKKIHKAYSDFTFKEWNDFFKSLQDEAEPYLLAISNDEENAKENYQQFLRSKTIANKEFIRLKNKLSLTLYNLNQSSMKNVNAQMDSIYLENYNSSGKQIEKEINRWL